eukprot:gene9782-11425_t
MEQIIDIASGYAKARAVDAAARYDLAGRIGENEAKSKAYESLFDTVRTGKSDLESTLGSKSIWEHFDRHRSEANSFNRRMTENSNAVAPHLLESTDLSSATTNQSDSL